MTTDNPATQPAGDTDNGRAVVGSDSGSGSGNGNGNGISYEQARAELRDIVTALEAGGQPLEESLALWQRGEVLAGICRRWLEGARSRLDAAIAESDS